MDIEILKSVFYSAQGNKPNQEDAYYPLEFGKSSEQHVFLICDGMGGHEKGEVASNCVATVIGKETSEHGFQSVDEEKRIFEHALDSAYSELDQLDHSDSLKKMGTTLVFLSICRDGILIAHIGDSRIYQMRPGKGVVFQTRDHSLVNDLIAAGEITEEEARTYPRRNVITRAIQPHQDYREKATYNIIRDIKPGDLFLLCTDGVVEKLDNDDLCRILLTKKSPDERIKKLQEECSSRNTNDNNTAILIEVATVEDDRAEGSIQSSDTDRGVTNVAPKIASSHKNKTREVRKNGSWKRWIIPVIICLIIIIALGYIGLSTNSKKKDVSSKPADKEQVQGIIKRQRR